ncbi:MAG: argininosuccinate lyase [Acidobacteriota bacterium]|nr:argininosuccinate lyase [Acidobacteriota bacterium]
MSESKKLWGGRFTEAADEVFARFNQSFHFDRKLFLFDVQASLAHAKGLKNAGILSEDEFAEISRGLQIMQERFLEKGSVYFNEFADAEDVHSFIEAKLTELIGDAGRKIHTGRSRNDQVATAMRLWTRAAIERLQSVLHNTQGALLNLAEKNSKAFLPGYTHLQRAQPVAFTHWCLAYFEMFERDSIRFSQARESANVSPLGSAALAGTSYTIDREEVAKELDFSGVSRNSLDAVSDRDFLLDFSHACSLLLAHLSRLAEDTILYSSTEFGFFELSDRIASGSSLMPQKKNPDAMELIRGKSARVFGHHAALLALLKGLPLAYNKDLQEDKEAVFDSYETTLAALEATAIVLENISLKTENMRRAAQTGFMNATELADYLVRRGVPFRTAHELTGQIVLFAVSNNRELHELDLAELKKFANEIEADVFDALSLEATLDSKNRIGGTSRFQVQEALKKAREKWQIKSIDLKTNEF